MMMAMMMLKNKSNVRAICETANISAVSRLHLRPRSLQLQMHTGSVLFWPQQWIKCQTNKFNCTCLARAASSCARRVTLLCVFGILVFKRPKNSAAIKGSAWSWSQCSSLCSLQLSGFYAWRLKLSGVYAWRCSISALLAPSWFCWFVHWAALAQLATCHYLVSVCHNHKKPLTFTSYTICRHLVKPNILRGGFQGSKSPASSVKRFWAAS